MSKGQTLRALVNERLAAAAEEIFVLIERTIVEYEEELCRSKEENQRKQQLLDKALSPRIELVRVNVQIPSASPGPGLNQKTTQTSRIKEEPEEQSGKQEEEQLPVSVPEHSSDPDNEDHCEPHSSAAALMETEADEKPNNQVQIRKRSTKLSPKNKSAPKTTVQSGHMSGADGDKRKKRQCFVCNKRFTTNQHLQSHIRIHTGEKPYSCPFCEKRFNQKSGRDDHVRTHTGERPFSCSICEKSFAHQHVLKLHGRIHTGEKPYSCPTCKKNFKDGSTLRRHTRTHTGEKPYSCSVCKKTFAQKCTLDCHKRTHTGEKRYGCSTCERRFADKRSLDLHLKTHR